MKLISHQQPEELRKGQKEMPSVLPPPRILLLDIHLGWAMHVPPGRTLKLIPSHKTWDWKPWGRAVLLGSPTLLLSPWAPLPNKVTRFVSLCVSLDNSFPSVRQEPTLGTWNSSPFRWIATLVGTFFAAADILTTWGTQGPLACQWTRPVATTEALLSLVSSWHGQMARVPR